MREEGIFECFPEKRISAFITKPIIINRLPSIYCPFNAIIFPAKAIVPPAIIAVALLILFALKPKSPAAVGTMNAPEKMVSAIRSDCMID